MKRITLALCGLLLSLSAGAVGVPFITAAVPLAADHPARAPWGKVQALQALYSVTLNRHAFGANILNVTIGKRQFSFVGSMGKAMPASSAPSSKAGKTQTWSGIDKPLRDGGSMLSLIKTPEGQILGQISSPGRDYEISPGPGGLTIVAELNPDARPRQAAPVAPRGVK